MRERRGIILIFISPPPARVIKARKETVEKDPNYASNRAEVEKKADIKVRFVDFAKVL